MERAFENKLIQINKDGTVVRRGVANTHANRVGKIIDRSLASDNKYEYSIIRVQWRDFAENFVESKKAHSKEMKKIRAQI